MKTKEEIEKLAQITYPKDSEDGEYCGFIQGYTQCQEYVFEVIIEAIEYGYSIDEVAAYKDGYSQCQQDMGDKKYTEDDIKEAAYFFVSKKLAANQGILDEEIQDFINSLKKQDNEQLCECSSKILPNGKIQLHLCRKCNEELFKES